MKPPRLAALIPLAVAGLHAPPAHAAFYTGDQLYDLCTAPRTSRDYVENTYECIAYVTGAVDAFNAVREAAGRKSCLPPDVTIDRLRTVTAEYLRDHPETRAGSAATLVQTAIAATWPCAVPQPAKPPRKKRRK